ncbi:MAG: glycosyltransferase family 4 protein [Cyanobacteria bacterium SZAS-4]|nr:glycosyltransferase family 4 protein [Cyanobacteria bacterium SZAS-4]
MTRILLSPSAFYPSLGGVEEICRNLSLQLRAKNFEVAIAVNRHPASLPEYELIDGIPVHRFSFEYPSKSLSGLGPVFRFPENTRRFLDFVKSYAPDLVHVICPSSNALYCYTAMNLLKQKTLVTLQGEFFMDQNSLYDNSAFARLCASRLLRKADAVTACSQYVLDDAKRRFDFAPRIEKVVFNGVDLSETPAHEQVDSARQKPYIFAIGRLVENKGFDWLLRAFQRLTKTQVDIKLILAGDGDARASLEALSHSLDLTEKVHFTGRQGRAEVSRLFNECQFFVLPSPVEPFGIVCLEAMRAGKATIATNTGGPPEFVRHEIDGLLVPPKDDFALFQAMDRLCSQPDLQKLYGQNALNEVKRFDWEPITRQYVEIYEQLLR